MVTAARSAWRGRMRGSPWTGRADGCPPLSSPRGDHRIVFMLARVRNQATNGYEPVPLRPRSVLDRRRRATRSPATSATRMIRATIRTTDVPEPPSPAAVGAGAVAVLGACAVWVVALAAADDAASCSTAAGCGGLGLAAVLSSIQWSALPSAYVTIALNVSDGMSG